ncbi:MAG TPA: hypothetical protein VKT32_07655 [Chthonomonadaceae bacterium]|nr:hypothetical protein [Chthonomonadaceae bacterium]
MNQKVSTNLVVAAAVALVLLLGFLAWRAFGNHASVADLQTIKQRQAAKAKD